jgi:hypothetical protein
VGGGKNKNTAVGIVAWPSAWARAHPRGAVEKRKKMAANIPCETGIVRLQKNPGEFASSHLSIFPHKTIAAASGADHHSINRESVVIGYAEESFCVPANLSYYMRKDQPLEMRYNPPSLFKQMLLGAVPIPLAFEPTVPPTMTGWVDFAHDGGKVYSGVFNGGMFNYVNEFEVARECAGRLIENDDSGSFKVAPNCSTLSPAELEDMDTIAKRTEWLFQIAGMRSHATDEQINECLATPAQKEKARALFGEGNSLPALTSPLRFSPPGSA